jgi:cytochrome P450
MTLNPASATASTGAADSDRQDVRFDHHRPDFDPKPAYTELRNTCPIAWSDSHNGFWVVSKYADVWAIARDDELFRSGDGVTIPRSLFRTVPIEMDPPEFLSWRRVLNPYFAPRAVAAMEDDIHRITHELIDQFITEGVCDFATELAEALPGRLTLRILGFPEDMWSRFHAAVRSEISEVRKGEDATEEDHRAALTGREWQRDQIRQRITHHREHPGDNLISDLVHADIDGRRPSDDDLVDCVALILDGGLGTTASTITTGLMYLAQNPVARDTLRADPSKIPLAVEEFLRHDSPIQGLARTVGEDCVFGGRQMHKGDKVQILWASANLDEDEFPNADEMMLDRSPNRHIAFGVGNHKCLGIHLARSMVRIALEAVLDRLPDYRIDVAGLQRSPNVAVIFSYQRVPATFTPGQRHS